MRFVAGWWQPTAIVFSALNLAGAGFAAGLAEPVHAGAHVVAAGAFAWWARWLGNRPGRRATRDQDRIEALELELDQQRLELAEAQERLDFAERLLSQAAEARRQVP